MSYTDKDKFCQQAVKEQDARHVPGCFHHEVAKLSNFCIPYYKKSTTNYGIGPHDVEVVFSYILVISLYTFPYPELFYIYI